VRQKDDKKVEQIYNAALLLVEQKGLAGITMCDISKAAGIATGTLYIYFKSKEELLNELFIECRKESACYYFKDFNEQDDLKRSFFNILENITNYRISHFEEFVFMEQCYHSPFITDEKRTFFSNALQPLFSLFEKGRAQRIIKNLDNYFLLWFIIGCINEFVKGSRYHNMQVTPGNISCLLNMCWHGIKEENHQ
jgi:TetR/AcrR family transcriptional regulator, repressor of fatR-cypB operon